jgi:hypothetical protein
MLMLYIPETDKSAAYMRLGIAWLLGAATATIEVGLGIARLLGAATAAIEVGLGITRLLRAAFRQAILLSKIIIGF